MDEKEPTPEDEVAALKAMSAMLDILVMLLDAGKDREVAEMIGKLPQQAAAALLALVLSEVAFQRKHHGAPQLNFKALDKDKPNSFPGQSTREHLDNL